MNPQKQYCTLIAIDNPLLSLGRDAPWSEYYRTTTFRPRTIGITASFRR